MNPFLGGSPKPTIPPAGTPNSVTFSTANGDLYNITNQTVENLAAQQPSVFSPNTKYSEIYHNSYNFFQNSENENEGVYYSINNYTNIFKGEVPAPVAYLINNQNSTESWQENMIFSITLELIEESITTELLSAFQTIHRHGGQLVGKSMFLEVVRKHLLEGTLDEFDSNYYLELAEFQRNDNRIQYTNSPNRELTELAGLSIVSQGSVISDSSQLSNIQKWQSRRARRFNTDINAKVLVDPLYAQTDKDLYLTDAGIEVETIDGQDIAVPIGRGDGYYMHIERQGDVAVPILTLNDIANTYHVPPDIRYNALTVIKQNPAYVLEAEALSNSNEFIKNDLGPSRLDPLYLKLDLKSLYYGVNSNPLISNYGGTYVLESNQDIIDEHVTDNGMTVTRVNIDYRDPIYRYILDSGKASLSLNDINFKNILDPKDYPDGITISRNMPFALIITPVVGSKHNPFNGQSSLYSLKEPYIRSIELLPDISIFDEKDLTPDLDEVSLYDDTSGDLKVGLVEPNDSQNIIYKYNPSTGRYLNTFYKDGEYLTNDSVASGTLKGMEYLVREVVDYLKDEYSPEVITWYDVIRRLPLNRVGQLLYSNSETLISELESGFRGGLLIKSVLNTDKNFENVLIKDDEKVIIKDGDR
jgi:hypothetical protein